MSDPSHRPASAAGSPTTTASWGLVARRLVTVESRQYAAVGRWLRRRPDLPEGGVPLPYAQLVSPVLWLFVLGSAIEVAVFHVLLHRWPWVQWPVTVLGVWSLVWMVGILAAYRTRPHVLEGDGLRLRAGVMAEVLVPYALLDEVAARERDLSTSVRLTEVQPDATTDEAGDSGSTGDWLGVGVSGRTNLQLRLSQSLTLPAPGLRDVGDVTVGSVGFWVDDPRTAARLLRRRAGIGG